MSDDRVPLDREANDGYQHQQWKNKVAQIEQRELEAHRDEIIADVKTLVEKYRKIFDWDVPDIDQAVADKLIVLEVRKALDQLEHKLLG
jgi:hypothetical protein